MTSQTIRPTGRSKILVAIAALVISTLLLLFAARHARADLWADGAGGNPSAAVARSRLAGAS